MVNPLAGHIGEKSTWTGVSLLFFRFSLYIPERKRESMPLAPEKIADLRLKQLELLQGIITRLSNQAAALKNFCITVTTAMCGLAVTLQRPGLALLGLIPVAIFGYLDARYLTAEKCFRGIFNRERAVEWDIPPAFDFTLASPQPGVGASLKSWSIVGFYLPVAACTVLIFLILGAVYGRLV
jgi:hypothetical protein